jgi:glycosyltransferase involved in cell wall biosynthesis
MKPRARIGLILFGVGDLSGGGGAERYFADLFLAWRANATARHCDLWLITDRESREQLAAVGRHLGSEHVVELAPETRACGLSQALALRRIALDGRFDLLHITLALPRHLPWLWAIAKRPDRVRVTVNINDFEVATALEVGQRPHGLDLEWRTYLGYFSSRTVDGFMVWYRRLAEQLGRFRAQCPVPIYAANYCFVDVIHFAPAAQKRNEVGFAGRFIPIKQPMMFVEAVATARQRSPETVNGWRFRVLGKGPLEDALRQRVLLDGLDDIVSIEYSEDMGTVLAHSKVFVSTQDKENFTSVAMLEAMACGNAIVTRDVGQTREFVREGANGILAAGDSADAVAGAILRCLSVPDDLIRMGAESRRITLEEHCVEHVLDEFDEFWRGIVGHAR